MHPTPDTALTIALALAVGMLVQALARHLRLPGIVLLLAAGVLLGPDVLNLVRPDALGEGLDLLVGFAVSIILFEGALNLDIRRLREQAPSIRALVTIGALITAVGGGLAAHWLLGWNWWLSMLFGCLVIVTGPTVITPLVRRIRLKHRVATVLEAEGVFGDAIGAILAVVALEIALSPSTGSLAAAAGDLLARLGVGALIGIAVGLLIAVLLRVEWLIPEGLQNVFVLSLVFLTYQGSNALLPESGVMAVIAAGTTLANFPGRPLDELRDFKEQLTVLMLGMLFVLLAADVRLASVVDLGGAALVVVAVLMFLIRPLYVLVSTARSNLTGREKAFIAWLAPRGIVAAAIASLFAQRLTAAGLPGGEALRSMVFLVIAVTVTFLGLTGPAVARWLDLRRSPDSGYVIAGGNPVGLSLAAALREEGEQVVVIDTDPEASHAAEEAGFRVVWGSTLSESVLQRAGMEGRAGCIGVTANEEINYTFARRARLEYRVRRVWIALDRRYHRVTDSMLEEIDARTLFGRQRNLNRWEHLIRSGQVSIERWVYAGDPVADAPLEEDEALLPLTLRRGASVRPYGDRKSPKPDDRVTLVRDSSDDELPERLERLGWSSPDTIETV